MRPVQLKRSGPTTIPAWVPLIGLLALGAGRSDEIDNLENLPRDERVRVLQARTWEINATRVQGELRIDGKLDDPAWTHAEPIDDFYQWKAIEGEPATERTEVRILFDETNLYIGFRAHDTEPEKVVARAILRDEAPSADDVVMFMIDAFNDQRSAIQFATNLNGSQMDLLQNGETPATRNANWDCVWDSKGSRFEGGWETETTIPFKSLRFPPPAPGQEVVFGIAFKRNIPRKNEEVTWPFISNDTSFYRPAEFGRLRGLRDIKTGRSIELRPYVLGGVDTFEDTSETRQEFGGDAKWGVTSGLTADFTVNTDFAQEEVDVQQINFTRFSLFFPEKRQFFLEGERMFQFGIRREAEMVFTRRIGLSALGEAVPIIAGARLSGRQGPYTVGAMNIQTDENDFLPSENFTVLRVRRDLLSRSSVGALFTNRQGGGTYNRVFGADINLLFKRVWSLEGFLARVDEPEKKSGNDSAYGRFAYESDRFGAFYRYLDLGESFRPGVGFVRRPNSREHSGELRYSPRPSTPWLRQFHFKLPILYISNQQGFLETRERGFDFTTAFESGEELTFAIINSRESIAEPFELRPDIVISPGSYNNSRFETQFRTFRRRHTSLNLSYATGGFWDGERDTIAVEANYRINTHLGFSGTYEVNWVVLPESSFTTHLASSRIQIAFRKEVVLMSLFQYNSENKHLSSNIRFNWIPKPGSDFFIVYNELDDWFSQVLQVKNRSLTVKFNYLFAL